MKRKFRDRVLAEFKHNDNFIKGRWGWCWVCHLPTRYIEINFEAHLHRHRCCPIADRAYWMTTLAGAPDFGHGSKNRRLYRFLRRVGK